MAKKLKSQTFVKRRSKVKHFVPASRSFKHPGVGQNRPAVVITGPVEADDVERTRGPVFRLDDPNPQVAS